MIAAVTGVAMFLPGASLIADRGSAPWKLGLILLAGLNILIFHRRTHRSVADWDTDQPTPPETVDDTADRPAAHRHSPVHCRVYHLESVPPRGVPRLPPGTPQGG
ncbi:hypothetical protein ABZY42_18980 [Streptomyces sp. NPDC006622]|uniref:hypothetical protein n=1 Tax=Streptomyces sp. NPDC006622 TaxID=3155459 RepID=UPI0033A74C5C